MKIIAINGSYRGSKGQTSGFIDLIQYGAEVGGAQFSKINLSEVKMNRCQGCNTCHKKDYYLQCIYTDKDDVAQIFEKIVDSDLVIYATPVYVFGISSLLKMFLDRLYSTSDVNQMRVTRSGLFFHHVNESICSKPFVSLICCDNLDAKTPQNAHDYFRTYAKFMDAPLSGEIIRNGVKLFGNIKDRSINPYMPKMAEVYDAFQQAGFELSTNGKIHKSTQRKAVQEIIPVPGFGLLKHMREFKSVMVERSAEIIHAGENAK